MKARTFAVAFLALLPLLSTSPAMADDGDTATVSTTSLLVGEQVAVRLEVTTGVGQTVEVNPAGPAWNGVEVVRVKGVTARRANDRAVHSIELVVASFAPGRTEFRPVVSVINGPEVTIRQLPALTLDVRSSLGPDDKLEISPLAPPAGIDGAESPLLRPAVALASLVALIALAGALFLATRTFLRRPGRNDEPPPMTPQPPTLTGAEGLIHTDPVGAYRSLSVVVRGELGRKYGFPASSLTTPELKRRMEAEGVDRWQARLVGGLLDECDAVVYAGYRPAGERREADLNMAREIVEGTA